MVLRVNLNYIADIEITTTPKVYVNVEATDVTKNEVELTVKDFVNTQEGVNSDLNTNLSAPTNLQAPQELTFVPHRYIPYRTKRLSWIFPFYQSLQRLL